MAPQAWFRIIGWNIKSPTLLGPWPRWTVRRGRTVRRLAALHPDVFCGIEMGSLSHVKWFRTAMRNAGWPMTLAVGGARWRYIFFNPKAFSQLRGGQRVLEGEYRSDDKEMTWAQLRHRGGQQRLVLIFCAHLENEGPDSIRRQQARSLLAHIEDIKTELGMSWDDCYLYLDCNDEGGVQKILESSRLSNLQIGSKQQLIRFNTMNRWSKKRRRVSVNHSMDWLGAGQSINAAKTFSPDCSDSSDHNLVGADILSPTA